jgi:hypothetical protein
MPIACDAVCRLPVCCYHDKRETSLGYFCCAVGYSVCRLTPPKTDREIAQPQLPEVSQPKYPLHAMTTYELRDYRRELEHAIAYYNKHHNTAPVLTDLHGKLHEVQAEEEDRAKVADA